MSSYLPHAKRGSLTRVINNIKRALDSRQREYASIVVTGLSGIIPGAIVAHHYKKHLVVLRKGGESSHGNLWEGHAGWSKKPFILLDDFISSGTTIERLLEKTKNVTNRDPEFVLLYGTYTNTPYGMKRCHLKRSKQPRIYNLIPSVQEPIP